MSQLVQIAPGVVFSSDAFGAEWVRKFGPSPEGDSRRENAHPPERRGPPKNDRAHTVQESDSAQMSLL